MADNWDINIPRGEDKVSTVDDIIRDDKEILLNALGKEHQFTTDTVEGYHIEGSAKIWVVATDNDLPSDQSWKKHKGRLCFVTGSNNLYYADGSSWKLLNSSRNNKMWSQDIGGDISCGTTGWGLVTWGTNEFEHPITTTGGHIRMVCTVSAYAQYGSIYFKLQMDDDPETGTSQVPGLGFLYADSSTVRKGTVTMHWCTSAEGAGGTPPRGDPPAAGEHLVQLMWKVDAAGVNTCGLVGGFSHHLFLEEI